MSMAYRISTLGCKVNQQESETLSARFEALGFAPARKGEPADVCVINSCTVTSTADSKTRQRIRQVRAANPEALVCVIGCLPEVAREAVEAMPEVDLAIGSLDKERTVEIIMEARTGIPLGLSQRGDKPMRNSRLRASRLPARAEGTRVRAARLRVDQRTRAMIKVCDGCDRFCSYCIVPYARGPVRSRSEGDVVAEAKGLLEAGYKELVLTGVNLALYGRDITKKEPSLLCSLVQQVCAIKTNEEYRVRLGSLEPTAISAEEALRIAGIRGVCPQFHLSLQSGCEKTLINMGRSYSPDGFAEIVRRLRSVDPLFSITTDVIVGFPGESDGDFEESLEFVRGIGFARVHVFKFSKRPGTRAADMRGQVPEAVKSERSRRMIETGEKSAARFLDMNTGVSRRTLIFGPDKSGRKIRGLTDNGIDILLPADPAHYAPNSFTDFTL